MYDEYECKDAYYDEYRNTEMMSMDKMDVFEEECQSNERGFEDTNYVSMDI